MVSSLAVDFGLKVGEWASIYLGLPPNGKPHMVTFWEPILEKVER